MPRYIDAELLKNKVEWSEYSFIPSPAKLKMLELIDDIPAADVEEVKHGEIIKSGRRYQYCSECKCDVSDGFDRCPWCGAKFDGKEQRNGQD